MKPYFTKRMAADGIARVRRGVHLLRWLHGGDAPLTVNPPLVRDAPSYIEPESWLLWLCVKRELIPPDLRGTEGKEESDASILSALGHRMTPVAPRRSASANAWLLDAVRAPMMMMANETWATPR